jgi:DNA-directed RNA polymerase specialized sigma24 family protein
MTAAPAAQVATPADVDTADAVNPAFTATGPAPKRARRPKRVVETAEYAGMCRRAVQALGRRVAAGDVEAIVELVRLSETLDQAMTDAVLGLRAEGYSWGEIAARLNVTRQAVYQRFGKDQTSC